MQDSYSNREHDGNAPRIAGRHARSRSDLRGMQVEEGAPAEKWQDPLPPGQSHRCADLGRCGVKARADIRRSAIRGADETRIILMISTGDCHRCERWISRIHRTRAARFHAFDDLCRTTRRVPQERRVPHLDALMCSDIACCNSLRADNRNP
jgi:hypothetical protein